MKTAKEKFNARGEGPKAKEKSTYEKLTPMQKRICDMLISAILMKDFIKQVNEALKDKSKGGTPLNVNETGWLIESTKLLKTIKRK